MSTKTESYVVCDLCQKRDDGTDIFLTVEGGLSITYRGSNLETLVHTRTKTQKPYPNTYYVLTKEELLEGHVCFKCLVEKVAKYQS